MTTEGFQDRAAREVISRLVAAVEGAADELSRLDGAIGDGDHGVNMRKGFRLAESRIPDDSGFADGLTILGDTLLEEIGGAMGPLYGSMFQEMGAALSEREFVDAVAFGAMLKAGTAIVLEVGGARPGDKTLVDVLVPARDAFSGAVDAGSTFRVALEEMHHAAEAGRDATRDLPARVGRASRLADRTVGTVDPGAASAALIVGTMASAIGNLIADRKPRPIAAGAD